MMLFLTFLALSTQISSHPVTLFRLAFSKQADAGWFWGWAWGSESKVSVVDRNPVLAFTSRPAAFGPEIADPILGYVIPLSSFTQPCPGVTPQIPPNLGCPHLCVVGPNEPKRAETWIALVQRGECEFVDKVREAQRLGADAVVVGGDDPDVSGNSDMLVNMYSPDDSSDVQIPSTFIRYSDYMTLSGLIATSNTSHSGLRTLSLQISTEFSPWEWYSPIVTFIIILVLPSLLTFTTLLIHRVRASRAAQRDRAPEDVVKCLPWRVWTGTGWEKHAGVFPGLGNVDDDDGKPAPNQQTNDPSTSHHLSPPHQPWLEAQHECAICLSSFAKGDHVRVLPCDHIFHLDEVDTWLIQRKKLCPICKADVTQPPPAKTVHYPAPSPSPPPTNLPSDNIPRLASGEQRGPTRPASLTNASERTPLLEPERSSQDPGRGV